MDWLPSLGFGEILLIGIVMLLFVGPERVPIATRWLGDVYRSVRSIFSGRPDDPVFRAPGEAAEDPDSAQGWRAPWSAGELVLLALIVVLVTATLARRYGG